MPPDRPPPPKNFEDETSADLMTIMNADTILSPSEEKRQQNMFVTARKSRAFPASELPTTIVVNDLLERARKGDCDIFIQLVPRKTKKNVK